MSETVTNGIPVFARPELLGENFPRMSLLELQCEARQQGANLSRGEMRQLSIALTGFQSAEHLDTPGLLGHEVS